MDKLPAEKNFIDRAVFGKLKVLGHSAVAACRRRDVLAPRFDRHHRRHADRARSHRVSADKSRPSATSWSTACWTSRPTPITSPTSGTWCCGTRSGNPDDTEGTYEFYQWIWNSLYENKPFDQFVREMLTASGDPRISPAVIWYREVDEINEQVEDTAQLFLGMRIQCARCHHHPFEKWSQDDYYGFSAFFSRLGRKPLAEASNKKLREKRLYHSEGVAEAANPAHGQDAASDGAWAASR